MYLMYLILWIILNGGFTGEIFLFGLVIAAAVFAFTCKFMGHSLKKEKQMYGKLFRLLHFLFVLIIEIVKANFTAIHMILSEEEEVEPVLVSFSSDMKTDLGKAFLANAITLTPGTITVMLENSEFVVHCLDKSLAAGMDSPVFVQLLKKLETDKEEK